MSDQLSDQTSEQTSEQTGQHPQQTEEESQGRVDTVAVLYILGGIPAIVAFVVVLFTLTNLFPNIPA